MSKAGTPKGPIPLQIVDPEHLAFAFHVANAVSTAQMGAVNPTTKKVHLELELGEVSEVSFTNRSFNRVMLTVIRELKTLCPGDTDEAFQARTAVIMRLMAMGPILRHKTILALISKNADGTYSLGPDVVLTFASAPLSPKHGGFKKMAFLKTLAGISVPPKYEHLRFHIPAEMIGEEESGPEE